MFIPINNVCYYFLYTEDANIDGRKSATKKTRSLEEMSTAISYFKMNIKSCVVPRKNMVEDAQKKFQVLQKRTWILIKAKVYNLVVYNRKKK